MNHYNPHQQIVERHFGVGTIVHRVLTRYYLAHFTNGLYRIVKEEDLHKFNKTTGEIS